MTVEYQKKNEKYGIALRKSLNLKGTVQVWLSPWIIKIRILADMTSDSIEIGHLRKCSF